MNDVARHTVLAALRRRLGDERGDTMVEVLLSITLTGIAFGAILGGLAQVSLTAQTRNSSIILEGALSEARRSLEAAPYAQVRGNTFPTPAPPGFTVFRAPAACDATVATRLCFSLPVAVDAANGQGFHAVSIEAAITGQKRTTVVHKSDR